MDKREKQRNRSSSLPAVPALTGASVSSSRVYSDKSSSEQKSNSEGNLKILKTSVVQPKSSRAPVVSRAKTAVSFSTSGGSKKPLQRTRSFNSPQTKSLDISSSVELRSSGRDNSKVTRENVDTLSKFVQLSLNGNQEEEDHMRLSDSSSNILQGDVKILTNDTAQNKNQVHTKGVSRTSSGRHRPKTAWVPPPKENLLYTVIETDNMPTGSKEFQQVLAHFIE